MELAFLLTVLSVVMGRIFVKIMKVIKVSKQKALIAAVT